MSKKLFEPIKEIIIPLIYSVFSIVVLAVAVLIVILVPKNNVKKSEIEDLKVQIETLDSKQHLLLDSSYNEYVSLETKHQQFVNEINMQNNRMEFLAWLIGSATLLTIIIGFIEYYGKFDKRVKLVVQEKTEGILIQIKEENKKSLKKVLLKTNTEVSAIDNLTLKIFFQNIKGVKEVIKKQKKYFDKMGFDMGKMSFIQISNPDEIEKYIDDELSVVFFDDTLSSSKTKDEENEWINAINKWFEEIENNTKLKERAEKVAFFYFGKGTLNASKYNASFAKSIYSLYHNLIDLMRYKYIMDKED